MARDIILDSIFGLDDVYADIERQYREIDYRPTFESVATHLFEEHQQYFDKAESPAGEQWPPLAPSTIAAKGHDTILIDSGRLHASLTGPNDGHFHEIVADGSGNQHILEWGSDIEYLTYHVTGTFNSDGSVRMPRRDPIGMTPEFVGRIQETIAIKTIAEMAK